MSNNTYPYHITTDSSCDLPPSYLSEPDFEVVSLTYDVNGKEYHNLLEGGVSAHDFCEMMRGGAVPKTSQITPERWRKEFEPLLKAGRDVLHLGFSSGLSGSTDAAVLAAKELNAQYPDTKLIVVDSLAASLGQGLFVHHVLNKRKEGASLGEAAEYAQSIVQNVCHYFTVEDLEYLHRGGRVSKASAILGGILGIKPVLHVDAAGHLIPITKVRGRRKSLKELLDRMDAKLQGKPAPDCVFISNADCLPEAQKLADEVKTRFGAKEVLIHDIGPVITTHSGPGTMALFFMADSRTE